MKAVQRVRLRAVGIRMNFTVRVGHFIDADRVIAQYPEPQDGPHAARFGAASIAQVAAAPMPPRRCCED